MKAAGFTIWTITFTLTSSIMLSGCGRVIRSMIQPTYLQEKDRIPALDSDRGRVIVFFPSGIASVAPFGLPDRVRLTIEGVKIPLTDGIGLYFDRAPGEYIVKTGHSFAGEIETAVLVEEGRVSYILVARDSSRVVSTEQWEESRDSLHWAGEWDEIPAVQAGGV